MSNMCVEFKHIILSFPQKLYNHMYVRTQKYVTFQFFWTPTNRRQKVSCATILVMIFVE